MTGLPTTIDIAHIGDITRAKLAVQNLAAEIGFSELEINNLLIVTSELTSNLLRHAGGGRFSCSRVEQRTIQLETDDKGPGIKNTLLAVRDGFSTGDSLGDGLGAINRLMDTLDIISPKEETSGTHITCRKECLAEVKKCEKRIFEIGLATRPYPGYTVNGDGAFHFWGEENVLVGVIDGLGHGPMAHVATERIKSYIKTHQHLPLETILLGADRESRATRGASIAVTRLWRLNGRVELEHLSIGNVETHLMGEEFITLPLFRGIVGKCSSIPAVSKFSAKAGDIILMYSDGISAKWDRGILQEILLRPMNEAAAMILEQYSRDNDDATVLLVKQV